jgi:hypothetical protein
MCVNGICTKICKSDKDCPSRHTCDYGICFPFPCSSDLECDKGRCCSGDCRADCGYGAATGCTIVSPGGVIPQGGKVKLAALGHSGDLSKNGSIVPGTMIAWSSSNGAVASLLDDGTLTGVSPGRVEVSAAAGATACRNTITFTVLSLMPDASNVIVYDGTTGAPVEGAQVKLGAAGFKTTGSDGVARFDRSQNNGELHVVKEGYGYVSYYGSVQSGYAVPLKKSADPAMKGGFRGKFDYSSFKKDYYMQGGFASVSANGERLFSFDPSVIFGENLSMPVQLPSFCLGDLICQEVQEIKECMDLPGGYTAGNNFSKSPGLMDEFRLTSDSGLHAAWGFGSATGSSDMGQVLELLIPIYAKKFFQPYSAGEYLRYVMNINDLHHGVQSALVAGPIPVVKTPEIDCPDGKKSRLVGSETVADYASFNQITLKASARMGFRTVLTVPEPPRSNGNCLTDVIAFNGANIPGSGYIPLGLGTGGLSRDVKSCGVIWPRDQNPFNIKDGQIMVKSAPNHGGLEGSKYKFILVARNLSSTDYDGDPITGLLGTDEDSIRSSIDFTYHSFPGFIAQAALSRNTRTIATSKAAVENAGIYLYEIVASDGRRWSVYTDRVGTDINLPALPPLVELPMDQASMTVKAFTDAGGQIVSRIFFDYFHVHANELFGAAVGFSSISCVDRSLCGKDAVCNTACELK